MLLPPRIPDHQIALLEKIRQENLGEYGPYLSAVERLSMMTIATGVQAVSEARYGRTDEALWYMDRIVETFNRKLPGSISEMMPDYGCFAIAWTSYGIVLPLIEYVFGIQPDAIHKTVVFEPQLPSRWEDNSIEDLPVGTSVLSFSRAKTAQGIRYSFTVAEPGWTLVLRAKDAPRSPIPAQRHTGRVRSCRHPHEWRKEVSAGGSAVTATAGGTPQPGRPFGGPAARHSGRA